MVTFNLSRSCRLIALITLLISALSAHAQMSDYERDKLLQVLNAADVAENQAIFDGTSFNPKADLDAAYQFMNAYVKGVNKVVAAVNGMSGPARSSEEGKTIINEVKEKIAHSKAMTNQFRRFEKAKKAEAAAEAATQADQSTSTNNKTVEGSKADTASTQTNAATESTEEANALEESARISIQIHLNKLNELMSEGIYDGDAFAADVSIEAANDFKQSFFSASNAAASAYNSLSGEAQRTDAARNLLNEIQQRQNEARRLNGALSNLQVAIQRAESEQRKARQAQAEAARNAMKPQCDAMRQAVVTPNSAVSQVVFAVSTAARANGWESAHESPLLGQLSPSMAQTFDNMAANCAEPQFADVMASGEFCEVRPNTDPVAWCRVAAAYVESKRVAAQAEAAKLAAIPAACKTFEDDVMSRRNIRRMTLLLNDPTAENLQLESMSKLLKTTDRIATKCAEPQYADIANSHCSDNPIEDARAWCDIATDAKRIFRERITRPQPNWEIIAEERYDNEDELDSRDGWVSIEGPTTLAQALSFDRMMYVNLADFPPSKQKKLFERLEITATDFDHYEDTLELIEELQESIEDGAEDWPELPRAQADAEADYGPPLAARLITEQWHSDAQFIDSWYGRGSWKIHKNNLGVIQRRTLPGYIMFKLVEDPYCQVRSFTLTEPYSGSATFQQAKGVRFGYVRFQDCDLR
jgi:hypothetical protein